MEPASPVLATPELSAIDGPVAAGSASTVCERRTASADTPIARAHALFVLHCNDDALPHAREAIAAEPHRADAWTNLGNLLRDLDDRRGTLVAFQQAMRLAPGRPEPVDNLGVALEHFGDRSGALAAFEAALECDPHYVDAHWNRALALLRQERFEEGFRAYEWRFERCQPVPRQCVEPVWDGRP